MGTVFDTYPTTNDITSDVERAFERAYWDRLNAADDYAAYVKRMALLDADDDEEDGDEPPPPPAAPAVIHRVPARPLWAVLLAESAGRLGPTKTEGRVARRQRRAELDRAA